LVSAWLFYWEEKQPQRGYKTGLQSYGWSQDFTRPRVSRAMSDLVLPLGQWPFPEDPSSPL
jgi:hypothetical protein